MTQSRRKPKTDWRGQACMDHLPPRARVEPEASVLKRVIHVLRAAGCCVFRNTVGFTLYMGRGVTYGLESGSADIVAIVPPTGRWLCVECKRSKGGKEEPEQQAWLAKVRSYGAVAGFARSPEEALALLDEARRPVER